MANAVGQRARSDRLRGALIAPTSLNLQTRPLLMAAFCINPNARERLLLARLLPVAEGSNRPNAALLFHCVCNCRLGASGLH